MEAKWRDKCKLYQNLKLGDYLLFRFKKLFTFKMLWVLFKIYVCFSFCSGLLWQFLQLLVKTIIIKKNQSKYFLRLVLGKFFNKKRMIPYISFSVLPRLWGTVLFILIYHNLCYFQQSSYLDFGRDIKLCSKYNMNGIL